MGDAEEEERSSFSSSPSSFTLESLAGLFGRNIDFQNDMTFSELPHALRLLHGLNQQRLECTLCDVTICVGNSQFPCHRNVLAASSPYFFAMFSGDMKERNEAFVNISGVDRDIMEQLIRYAYTSDITITQDNAQQLLSAANMLQISSIREACSRFLKTEMHPSNCLGIHCFAEAHVCQELAEMAKEFTLMNFTEVAKCEEILSLPDSKLIEFVKMEELNVASEETVLQAVLDWYRHDPENRTAKFPDVLSHVRLPEVSPYFLFDKLDSELILSQLPECRRLVEEAMKYFMLKDRVGEFSSTRARPRGGQVRQDLLVIVGGEIYSKNYLNSVDCYRLGDERWLQMRELPFPRCHHGTVVSEDRHIYVTGGLNKEKHVLKSALRYEPALDRWTKVENMIQARARHGIAALDGWVYVVGGYDGVSHTNTLERYNPSTNVWTQATSMTLPLSRCQAAGLNGRLYVAGGCSEPGSQCVDVFWRYDPHLDSWENLAPLRMPQCVGALETVAGDLYVVGGWTDSGGAHRHLSRYSIRDKRWQERADMIDLRSDPGISARGKKIYVCSGRDGENSFYDSIEEYDVMSDTWRILTNTSMPFGRCHFGCVALSGPKKT